MKTVSKELLIFSMDKISHHLFVVFFLLVRHSQGLINTFESTSRRTKWHLFFLPLAFSIYEKFFGQNFMIFLFVKKCRPNFLLMLIFGLSISNWHFLYIKSVLTIIYLVILEVCPNISICPRKSPIKRSET